MRKTADHSTNRRESGAALLVSMLMLALMGLVGMASLDTVMRDRQVAGYSQLAQSALYAADAGVAESLDILRSEVTGAALAQGECLTATVTSKTLANRTLPNQAFYRDDPDAPNGSQICMMGNAEPCGLGQSLELGQGATYMKTLWSVRVQGVAPGGATSQIQATAERCHAFN